jgi:hypothetical protein
MTCNALRVTFALKLKLIIVSQKNIIFGATYDIYEKVLKAGYLAPPLIVNFKWTKNEKPQQEIRFYPFVGKDNIKKYTLSEKARRANLRMFRYEKLDKIPYMVLYQLQGSGKKDI